MALTEHAEQRFSLLDFGRLLHQNRKQAGIYGIIFIIISFNLCLFLPANFHGQGGNGVANLVQLICFAIMGVVNVWFFYFSSLLSAFSYSKARLAFVSLLIVVVALLMFIYYYISGNNDVIMAFASSGAFLLPFLIYQSWVEMMEIPERKYAVWQLPPPGTEASASGNAKAANTIQVQLKLFRRQEDSTFNLFPVTTSSRMKLGKVFERFIEEQQGTNESSFIEVADTVRKPFTWQFFQEKWFGLYRKNLNPAQSLQENKIPSNAKIAIVRVREEPVN